MGADTPGLRANDRREAEWLSHRLDDLAADTKRFGDVAERLNLETVADLLKTAKRATLDARTRVLGVLSSDEPFGSPSVQSEQEGNRG